MVLLCHYPPVRKLSLLLILAGILHDDFFVSCLRNKTALLTQTESVSTEESSNSVTQKSGSLTLLSLLTLKATPKSKRNSQTESTTPALQATTPAPTTAKQAESDQTAQTAKTRKSTTVNDEDSSTSTTSKSATSDTTSATASLVDSSTTSASTINGGTSSSTVESTTAPSTAADSNDNTTKSTADYANSTTPFASSTQPPGSSDSSSGGVRDNSIAQGPSNNNGAPAGDGDPIELSLRSLRSSSEKGPSGEVLVEGDIAPDGTFTSTPLTLQKEDFNFASAAKYQDETFPYKASNLTSPPFCDTRSQEFDGLLIYPGMLRDNILQMSLLSKALDCLDIHFLKDSDIDKLFRHIRDRQYFPNSTGSFTEDPNKYKIAVEEASEADKAFMRRLPWLNPDDGCMTRAEFAVIWAYEHMYLAPSAIYKFFLFGPLEAPAKFGGKDGFVRNWVYHTAPMVFSRERGFVILDPALDHFKPLPLEDWILTMAQGAKKITEAKNLVGFAIANRFVYWPNSYTDETESRYSLHKIINNGYKFMAQDLKWIEDLLSGEWSHVADLGYDPARILKDEPPWKSDKFFH